MPTVSEIEARCGYAPCGDARSGRVFRARLLARALQSGGYKKAEPAPLDMAQVEVRVRRDAASDEWCARFLREAGDCSDLDGGRPFSRPRRGGGFAPRRLGPR